MKFVQLKMVLMLNGWLFAKGSPVAMLQHATSSQSIVFHPTSSPIPNNVPGSSSIDQYSGAPPKYEYKYEVSDHQTGDRKSHWESREGDRVRGVYTLYEPDGALRTVEYTADALHGFNAVVRRDEPSKHQHPRTFDSSTSYNRSPSNEHEGYGGYMEDRGYLGSHGNEGYNSGSYPGVGYSVSHSVDKKLRENVKPF